MVGMFKWPVWIVAIGNVLLAASNSEINLMAVVYTLITARFCSDVASGIVVVVVVKGGGIQVRIREYLRQTVRGVCNR